jgi:predicted esterase
MINLRHIIKFLGLITLGLLLSSQSFADKKFEKDLKKISIGNGFIDNLGNIYPIENISDKKNTILIIYTHGGDGDQSLDKCLKKWNLVPPVIRNLHDKKINNYQIKIYRLCTGVRGWSKSQQDRMWKSTKEKRFTLKDNSGELLINKNKDFKRTKIIKSKIDNFKKEGFKNIILAGHSMGGWASIKLKTNHPNLIKGVIGLHPGSGGTKKNRREWPYWEEIRNYGFGDLSNLNALIITHDKDNYNSPKDYSMFENHNEVKFVNLTSSKCKKKATLGGYHGIALTKCFADEDPRSKEIAKYLEEIF